jgi:hypothetical protein
VTDGDTAAILERIAVALERIANHVDPAGRTGERRPAVLSKATYNREERETQQWKEQATQKSQDRADTPARSNY